MNPFAITDADRAAAEQFLFSRIDYERAAAIPYQRDFRLDRMVRFLARLGNPQVGLQIVHVAGTKGKGSTAAMIASVLTAAGYRTGLYTSPHLNAIEERIRIDGVQVPADAFVDLVSRVRPIVVELDEAAAAESPPSHGPTYFEIITAMALVYFADHRVDWAVLEVGLGGRLDSTNTCLPAVSVITSISLDHIRQLGNTLADIASEKAGIIKPGVPVVSGVIADEPREVIRQTAAQHGCRLVERTIDFDARYCAEKSTLDFEWGALAGTDVLADIPLALLGEHQAANAATALAALEELRRQGCTIEERDIRRGLAEVQSPARVELVRRNPAVVLDAAHNVASIAALVKTLKQSFRPSKQVLIFATTRDKDARGMLTLLVPQFDTILLTQYQINPRGVPVEELAAIADALSANSCIACPTANEAWQRAQELAGPSDLIAITGSFFIAAELGPLVRETQG